MAKCYATEFVDRYDVYAIRVSINKCNDRDSGEKIVEDISTTCDSAYVDGRLSDSVLTNCRVARSG